MILAIQPSYLVIQETMSDENWAVITTIAAGALLAGIAIPMYAIYYRLEYALHLDHCL